MKKSGWLLLLLLLVLPGCSQIPLLAPATPPPATELSVAPPPGGLPDVKPAARAYLDAWKAENYSFMYQLLTSLSKDAISADEFVQHYQGVASEAALDGVDYNILSAFTQPDSAQVSYRVTLHSLIVGDVQADTLMNFSLEKGEWRVQWDDTLILPQLKGSNYLAMVREGYVPARANIYDRDGHALVAQTDATAVGLYPDYIDPQQASSLYTELESLLGIPASEIPNRFASFPAGQGWYLPLGEVSTDQIASRYDTLATFSGLVMNSYKARYYFGSGIAPHIIGYVGLIQPEEAEEFQRRGYQIDERIGRAGLEKWGEDYLAGKRGGALYVYNDQGKPVTRLAETPPQPSQSIYTTLDRDFQVAVQDALSGFRGAAVVLERDTGRVLAIASSPGFDPNAFEPVNFNSDQMLDQIYSNPAQPLLDRATQGQYPLGSIFKIITMAAALESEQYTPDTTYQCGYTFEELPGAVLHDWTYTYYLQDRKTMPSGLLTLSGGLVRSCNPWFFHIGLDFYNQGLTELVPNMARGFGLGVLTGLAGIDEAAGQVPELTSAADATNLAIGQGGLLVTPLQAARFIAAIGNGGTLLRPQVVEQIAPPGGDPTYQFQPDPQGKLPVKPENLAAIQKAMEGVISSTSPRGTANHVFLGLDIPVAGKTGTAESNLDLPHAWFGGYTFAEREDLPDIAAIVLVENIGEGSVYAAPIFRRIVELYFRGSPGKLYPWESSYGVISTPTPEAPGGNP